ncbi:hypothetical protein [Fibrobacter succinogenes]|uniref:hypothetical protein n=1 Tax=Fibrobacter succinogenes TaxID=833 RepID=UPI0015697734|nr:hypothetical protein [Fibrobacter succinogenes]
MFAQVQPQHSPLMLLTPTASAASLGHERLLESFTTLVLHATAKKIPWPTLHSRNNNHFSQLYHFISI